MLEHTFIHIPTIGPGTEKKFWTSGIRTLDEFIQSPPDFLSPSRQQTIGKNVHLSMKKIKNGDANYFCDNLPTGEKWRLFREYQHSTAYIDIETTGLGDYGDIITTIALYDGRK
ncbi:MAG: exonuclease, partial [Desulfonatronovibrio sp.]